MNFGDPFYRIHDDGNNGAGLYDRLEICYEPRYFNYAIVPPTRSRISAVISC